MSKETRKNLSLSHIGKNKGEKHPNYGKHLSEEQKKKMIISRGDKCFGENHYLYGKHQSDEVKRKVSEANKGRHINVGEKNPNYGKSLSDKHRENISKSLTGRDFSDEHKKHLSEARKGIVFSEEHKENLRISHVKQSKKIVQKDLEGNILNIWDSIAEAHRNVGIPKNNISLIINNKKDTNISWGYIWELYIDNEEGLSNA